MGLASTARFDGIVRYGLKTVVFAAALLPLASLVAGIFAVSGFSLGANPVSMILHTCGKWALIFLLITLGVRPLIFLTGRNEWLRLRRMLGLFAFSYALLHFLVYLILDQSLDFGAVWRDIAKRPYITIGFTALLLLLPLAATSTNRMMRRLGRRWQKLHRLVYLIAVLGVWHYYWEVKADVRKPLMYAAILAVLFALRWWQARSRRAPAVRQTMSPAEPLRQNS
ncbi:MAG: sulfite oxidase heme-binding subunit YedZ [Steroidobacterales bacterium]